MPKIGIIVNPNAGQNRRRKGIKNLLAGAVGHLGIVRVTRTIREITEVAREFYREKVDLVGISGGDGTIQKTLTGFAGVFGEKRLPRILPLKGGTMNTVAHSLRISGNGEGILRRMVYALRYRHSVPSKEIDLLKVGNEYGAIFGMGATYNFLDAYYNKGKPPSPAKATRMAARLITSGLVNGEFVKYLLQPIKAQMWLDKEKIPFPYLTWLLVCTVKEIGLGFTPTYRAEEQEGYFHLLSFRTSSASLPPKMPVWVPKIYFGLPLGDETVYDEVGKKLLIKTEKPTGYQLDGELFPPKSPLEVSVPARIKIIRV